jgi:hypothetical protein
MAKNLISPHTVGMVSKSSARVATPWWCETSGTGRTPAPDSRSPCPPPTPTNPRQVVGKRSTMAGATRDREERNTALNKTRDREERGWGGGYASRRAMRLEEHDPQNKPPQLRQWWRRRIIVKGALHAILGHLCPPPATVNVDVRPHGTHTRGWGGVGRYQRVDSSSGIHAWRTSAPQCLLPHATAFTFLPSMASTTRGTLVGWLVCRMDCASACLPWAQRGRPTWRELRT